MAGLPVISTLRMLQGVGDKVTSLAGVFSGTLSFVFNTMTLENLPFSQCVRLASEKGFTEPDERDDLSGVDMVRKLVVLARVIGLRVSQSDVKWTSEPLVTPALASMSLDEFRAKGLPLIDASLAAMQRGASQEGKRLVFLGRVERKADESGVIECGVHAVDKNGPLGGMTGSNNLVTITTELGYPSSSPMVISGSGAGATVTAQGLLSDLVRS